jgi:CRP-like cAMP-binding protein
MVAARRRITSSRKEAQNQLLAALRAREHGRLVAECESVQLHRGEKLHDHNERIQHVYFPIGGTISLIASIDGSAPLEVGLVGAEGMLGVSLVLDVRHAPLRALVQGTGSCLRMQAAQFSRELKTSRALRSVIQRYLYVHMTQLAQTSSCMRFHVVEQRLARWLLMTRDRTRSNQLDLTQEFMAVRLGVRRAGITLAAHTLQKRKLIRYSRGNLVILDGAGLEGAACPCYAAALNSYTHIMERPRVDPGEPCGRHRARGAAREARQR